MAQLAIHIDRLGKRFPRRISATSLAQRFDQARSSDWFWALQDVTLEIRRGETVGLVGSNGAGKTTLLRILSRVTRPSEGRATIYGTVGALLETGAGFHAELTGRENIDLNGALLGLRNAEIRCKLDAIVAFAGLEQAIDTPYKWYSSGMRARLAFSLAVHLESDILLVDEALAVGDAEFRQRAAERLRALIGSERTILLAGHQLATMAEVCDSVIWLEHGRLRAVGPSAAIVAEYLAAIGAAPMPRDG